MPEKMLKLKQFRMEKISSPLKNYFLRRSVLVREKFQGRLSSEKRCYIVELEKPTPIVIQSLLGKGLVQPNQSLAQHLLSEEEGLEVRLKDTKKFTISVNGSDRPLFFVIKPA